jgi:hypothetical protein
MTRRTSIEAELARLEAEERLLQQTRLETASLVDYCRRVAGNLKRCDQAEKRRVLEALNITVVWHPEQPLEIRGSIPAACMTIATHAAQCTVPASSSVEAPCMADGGLQNCPACGL